MLGVIFTVFTIGWPLRFFNHVPVHLHMVTTRWQMHHFYCSEWFPAALCPLPPPQIQVSWGTWEIGP